MFQLYIPYSECVLLLSINRIIYFFCCKYLSTIWNSPEIWPHVLILNNFDSFCSRYHFFQLIEAVYQPFVPDIYLLSNPVGMLSLAFNHQNFISFLLHVSILYRVHLERAPLFSVNKIILLAFCQKCIYSAYELLARDY